MNKLLITLAALGVLAGCASQAPREQDPVPVVSGKPSEPPAEAVKPKVVEQPKVTPVEVKPIVGDPLKDPANILSKRSVFYDYDSNVIKDEFKPLVTAHARFLTQNRNRKIAIQGNTDERGSREYNIALGQRRADSVKQMMVLLGVQEAQIETVSFGEEKPRNAGKDEAAFSENRRSDIVYDGE
jgi:peptidoglycan-associated lipoprotein